MISLYGLFILLLTAGTIYAQGDTNEGDGVDQASGSKDVTSLPRRTTSTTLPTTLQESNTSDQNGASSSTDIRPGNECTGGHGIRKISSPCPQQQSPPEPQSSTSYDPPQSDKMPLPARVERLAAEFYNQNWESEQYNAFIAGETKYFESEYRSEKELGKGGSGVVYLATRKSDGMQVAYKSIPTDKVYLYASESSPPPRCHIPNPLVLFEKTSVEQCMSPRSPNILLPYEFIVQRYLSRPGYENPYVPMVFDYYTLKYEYVLVMEYFDEDWVNLAKYVEEKERLDISEARNIFREIVNGVISLKRHGVVNRDIHDGNVMYNPATHEVKLIDFGLVSIFPGWEEGKSFPVKPSDSSPMTLEYKAGIDELKIIETLGNLLYILLTGMNPYIDYSDYEEMLRDAMFPESDTSKSGLKESAISLIAALVSRDTDVVPSIEAILENPFFQLNNKE
ncbi:hypothetical protein BASA83_011999 [Batrachochytrium salamandrivorans]|nr:hypothetical protein BASA83_011999 [Batrachochytrium salamandrivorans]